MTRGDMVIELQSRVTQDDATRCQLVLNWAQHRLIALRGWSFLRGTKSVPLVASQEDYDLTGVASPVVEDFGGILDVFLELTAGAGRVKLLRSSPHTYDRLTSMSRPVDKPAIYCVRGGTHLSGAAAIRPGGHQVLSMWPIPLATAGNGVNALVRYSRHVGSTEMTSDAHLPIVPASQHHLLVEIAAYFLYNFNHMYAQAQQQRLFIQDLLQGAIEEDMRIDPPRDDEVLELDRRPSMSSPQMTEQLLGATPARPQPEGRRA